MHISSLPGNYGIGSFGKSAYDFVDFLVQYKTNPIGKFFHSELQVMEILHINHFLPLQEIQTLSISTF